MISVKKNFSEIAARFEFHEGCRLMPYYDHLGKLTIGIGRCIDTNPFNTAELKALGDWQHGITRNAALMLLRNDVQKCLEKLKKLDFFAELDDERQYALLDMCFQLGFDGLLEFKKMLEAIRRGRFDDAAAECLRSRYAKQTPKRAMRIARVIREGIWSRE